MTDATKTLKCPPPAGPLPAGADVELKFSAMLNESDALLLHEYWLFLKGKDPTLTFEDFHDYHLPQALVVGCATILRILIYAEKNQPTTPSSGHTPAA